MGHLLNKLHKKIATLLTINMNIHKRQTRLHQRRTV